MLASNPAEVVIPLKIEHKDIEVFTKEELAERLNGAKETPLYTPLFVMATTGIRRSELLAL